MILILLSVILAHMYTVTYHTINDTLLNQNPFTKKNLILKYNTNKLYLTQGSKSFLLDKCKYTLRSPNSFGYLDVCKVLKGVLCDKNKCTVIQGIKDPYTLYIKEYPLKKLSISNTNLFNIETRGSFEIRNNNLQIVDHLIIPLKPIFHISISLINDYSRYKILKDNSFNNTLEIFKSAKRILENIKFDSFLIKLSLKEIASRTTSDIIKSTQVDDSSLELFKDEMTRLNTPFTDKLNSADLIILLRYDTISELEGLSYQSGFGNKDTKYLIVNISDTTIKGVVLVHEILHTLGSKHSKIKGEIMGEVLNQSSDIDNLLDINISKETVQSIEMFVLKNFL